MLILSVISLIVSACALWGAIAKTMDLQRQLDVVRAVLNAKLGVFAKAGGYFAINTQDPESAKDIFDMAMTAQFIPTPDDETVGARIKNEDDFKAMLRGEEYEESPNLPRMENPTPPPPKKETDHLPQVLKLMRQRDFLLEKNGVSLEQLIRDMEFSPTKTTND